MKKLLLLALLSSGCSLLVNALIIKCGDNQTEGDEACDDGNNIDGDGCEADCTIALLDLCGDGVVQPGVEDCDDGNNIAGDSCDETCHAELCGNGLIQVGEACDDGPNNSDFLADACRTTCFLATCGDGVKDTGEDCDFGDVLNNACANCIGANFPICGNGQQEAGEGCDDGNPINDDGCDTDCTISQVIEVDAGGSHSCALFKHGSVRCWGDNSHGQLGYGQLIQSVGDGFGPSIKSIGSINFGTPIAHISLGDEYSCAITSSKSAICWGRNDEGQLGYTDTDDKFDPIALGAIDVSIQPAGVTQIAAGRSHTCALFTGDQGEQVQCWGANDFGQLGHGDTESTAGQIPANKLPLDFGGDVPVDISVGDSHSCAEVDLGGFPELRCWGKNDLGQLGLGDTVNVGDIPSDIPLFDNPGFTLVGFASLSLGGEHSCIFDDDGATCWGEGLKGQLGNNSKETIGDDPNDLFDVVLINENFAERAITAGGAHTCVVANGSVFCWGDGSKGQLGYGSFTTIGDDEPIFQAPIVLGGVASQVSAGGQHTCARLEDGSVRCWGSGNKGQLGADNTADSSTATSRVPLF